MQTTLRIFSASALLLSAVTFSATSVFAEENATLSDEMRGAISTNCASIRQSLKSLQRADSKTRVILGTTYQSMLNDFITPLNVRLTKANRPNTELTEIQGDFVAARDDFSSRFIKYSRQLENLIAIDCKAEPDEFYKQLVKTRRERAKLSTATAKVNEAISDHISAANNLKIALGETDAK